LKLDKFAIGPTDPRHDGRRAGTAAGSTGTGQPLTSFRVESRVFYAIFSGKSGQLYVLQVAQSAALH
jgi:hypothetical protein